MDTSQKDFLVVLVLGLVGLAFLWAPLPATIPLFLLSYLLLLVLPGFALISYLKPKMSVPSRLICGFLLSLALLVGIFFIMVLLEMYGILDYLPSLLLIFSMLVASENYFRTRSRPEKDDGQLTLFESIERAQRVRELVNHQDDPVKEEGEPEPVTPEPAISEFYHKPEEYPPDVETVPEAPKEIREDVKPLREEHLQNGFEEKKPEPEVSHPLWREQTPHEEGFRYWDLFVVILLTALTLAFLNLNLFIKQEYNTLIAYIAVLFLFGYVVVAVIYPAPKRIGTGSRLVASFLIGLLIFAVSFLLYSLDLVTLVPVPFFYVFAILIVLLVFLAVFRRRATLKELKKEDEPPLDDKDILIEHDYESIKAREEAESEPLPEEVPVIIPEHVILQDELEEQPDEDIEAIIPEIATLKKVLEEDKVLSQDQTQQPKEETPSFQDEDVETIIPEIADLKHVLEEDETLPREEPPAEDEVEVIIPEHVATQKEKAKPESILKTDETEMKVAVHEETLDESEKQPEIAEEPEEKEEPPMKPEEIPEKPETPSEEKPTMVLPWIEREKEKPTPHVYEDKPRPITPKRLRNTRPLDLILVVIFTLLTAAFVLIPILNETPVRTVLGVLLVLFLPGYSLIAALFPRRTDLDSIERVALSFGLSIAVTPLIGLALNYTPWGIRLDPILICLVGFTLAMCLIAYLRRRTLPDNEKFAVSFGLFFSKAKRSFRAESRTEKILTIILILSILIAIGTVAFVVLQPKQGEKFTEFYLLGPDGKASNYPTNLTAGENATVIVGIVNHEYATTNYRLVVRVDNKTLQEGNITLADKEKTEIPVSFTASTPGQRKMEFLLYKLPDTNNPYRTLHLWYQVS